MRWHLVVDGTGKRGNLLNLLDGSSLSTFSNNDSLALYLSSLIAGMGNLAGNDKFVNWLTQLCSGRESACNAGRCRLGEGGGGHNTGRCASSAEEGTRQHVEGDEMWGL